MINCLILAGGRNLFPGEENKALIKIDGKEMVLRVSEVMLSIDLIDKIAVIGPSDQLSFLRKSGVDVIQEKNDLISNIIEGVNFLGTEKALLISSSDIPLITKESIYSFLNYSTPCLFDFYCPIIRKEDMERSFPGGKRTYVKLKEGTFTLGNIFLINPIRIKALSGLGRKILDNRKKPLKIASIFGVSSVIKLLLGSFDLIQAMNLLERHGVFAKPIPSSFPEIGFDIDKPEDLEIAKISIMTG